MSEQTADAKGEEIAELRKTIDSYAQINQLLTHKIIACGVAASHPDASLSRRGAYAGKWNSAQAEAVRRLREDRDTLLDACRKALYAIKGREHTGFLEDAIKKATGNA